MTPLVTESQVAMVHCYREQVDNSDSGALSGTAIEGTAIDG